MDYKDLVIKIQKELNSMGVKPKLVEDGDPGVNTQAALSLYELDIIKFKAIQHPDVTPSGFTRAKLARIAEEFCAHNYKEGSVEVQALRVPFAGKPCNFGMGNWAWCGATAYGMSVRAGLNMPPLCPSKFGLSFAYVEAIQQWAIEKGFYHDNDGVFEPEPGDWVLYDWKQTNINQVDNNAESHVGIHLRKTSAGYVAAEGNTGNMTAIRTRPSVNIQGWVRIPDNYSFA